MKQNLVKKNILGVGITDASSEEILEYVFETIEKSDKKVSIVTPNPEILVYSVNHPEFRKILNSANLALNDGIGGLWASKILGKPLKSRVTGVELVENFCRESSKRAVTVGFLGGRDEVAELAADCLVRKYPKLKVVFVSDEWVKGDTAIGILFVAFGFPKQEEWIYKNLPNIPVRVAMGVGGSFDYLGGKVVRAPLFLRNLGLEWLFRLCVQPWRIKRQRALLEFIYLVLKEKLFFYK